MRNPIDRMAERLKKFAATDLTLPAGKTELYQTILEFSASLDKAALSRFSLRRISETRSTGKQTGPAMQIHTVIGCDIGKLVHSIPARSDDTLVILAPSPAAAYLMLDQIDPADLQPPKQIALFNNHNNFLTYLKEEQNFWKKINLWLTPLARSEQPELCAKITEEIKYGNAIAANEMRTLNRHYFSWAENENRNLNKMVFNKHAESSPSNQSLAGTAALLIGAGPSLAKAMPFLKRFKQNNQTLIIAASTALRALEKEGIIPHFTIIIEGKEQVAHFATLPDNYISQLNLLAALQTNPTHLAYSFKDIFWFHHDTSPTATLVTKLLPQARSIHSRGNVISDGLQLALNWGCTRIGLCGCDMAYNAAQKYCSGLEKENSEQEEIRKSYFPVPGQQGETLYAPAEFIAYAQNLGEMAAKLKENENIQKIYNLSSGGRRLEGIEEKSPEEFYNLTCRENPGINEKLASHINSWSRPATENRYHLDNHRKILESLQETLRSIQKESANVLSEHAKSNTMRHLLDQLPEFTNGAALIMIPWLHRLHIGNYADEDIAQLSKMTVRLLQATSNKQQTTKAVKLNQDSKKINVAMICGHMITNGANRIIMEHCLGMQRLGHTFTLYALQGASPFPKLIPEEKIRHYVSGRLADALDPLHYDLVINNTLPGAKETILAAFSAPNLAQRKAFMNSVHFSQNFDPIFLTGSDIETSELPFHFFNKHLTCSPVIRDLIGQVVDKPISVVGNGIDYKSFQAYQRPANKIKSYRPRVGYMTASRSQTKRAKLAFDIFALLKRKDPSIETIVISSIPWENQAIDQVLISPNFETKMEALSSLDVFLNTSSLEAFPLTPLEGMALGVPVVATDSYGSRCYITTENCCLHDTDQANPLAEAILDLLQNHQRRAELALAGIRTAESLDWHNVIPKIEIVYQSLVNNITGVDPFNMNRLKFNGPTLQSLCIKNGAPHIAQRFRELNKP